jgi:hypothetical protein
MNRKFVMAAVLCLALVALMALAAAPIAAATAESTAVSAIETYAAPPNPVTPEPWVTGGVAHWTLNNLLRETATSPLITGFNHTHVVVLFDPATGAGTMHGTWQIVVDGNLGVWEGTFAGSINVLTGVANANIRGKGVSGAVAGMVFRARDVNPDGVTGLVTGTILAPKGF